MKTLFAYIIFAISISVISWIVGMIINAFLMKTTFYSQQLSNLNFINNERQNKIIGVGVIKWMVKNTFFKFFNQKLKISRRIDVAELKVLRDEMTKSEIDHLIAFGFVTFFAVQKSFTHGYLFGVIIMLVNILMNLYPSLLQQQNKRRIDKLAMKIKNN